MKKIIVSFVSLILSLLVTGVSTLFAQQDPGAKMVLDELSAKTKSYQSLKTKFIYRYEDKKDDSSLDKEGKIVMKGNMYKLNFMESVIFYDGKTMWNYLTEQNEVNIIEPDPGELEKEESFLENPRHLLKIYNEKYKYKLADEFTRNNITYLEIDLYPKDLNKPYSRIKLIIDKEKVELYSASVFGKDGINHLFTFPEIKTNFPVEDSYFKFNPKDHPGVEIIDLR